MFNKIQKDLKNVERDNLELQEMLTSLLQNKLVSSEKFAQFWETVFVSAENEQVSMHLEIPSCKTRPRPAWLPTNAETHPILSERTILHSPRTSLWLSVF